ncbi:V-set domain-containing T-cell activation inhibitor 1 isoform X3 [Oreochromis niloticus]|uniref:V-set domain-containing T-cell activation inhibitor 1 isoform X3 n=1 Tax=Oreochromis niloticus TaxID=8128 RepID=UPI000DF3FA0C|nr:V-set domain-containing T-cell activation inhibitor 1 isoform X3 [Oreochromis niloticus]
MQHLWMQAAVKNDRRRRLQRQLLLSFSTQMLSIVVFLSLLIILVSGLKELKVNPGQDASLQCQGPRDAEITLLEWNRADLKSDDYVFMYRNQRPYESYQHVSFRGRVDLMDPSMKDGNVSVTLRNVRLSDTGTYKCQITTKETESVVHECSINLTVTTPDAFITMFLTSG